MPGVNVEPSSLTQECFTAVGSKKIAADVSDASISCEAMENIMAMIWLETVTYTSIPLAMLGVIEIMIALETGVVCVNS
jgi:hypothetical protein